MLRNSDRSCECQKCLTIKYSSSDHRVTGFLSSALLCASVWKCFILSHKKIQKVINFAARIISGRRKYEHISDVTRSLGCLSAREFVDLNDICLLHRIISEKQPMSVASQIKRNHQVVSRSTRQSNLLTVPRARTRHGQRTFLCRSAKLYNTAVIRKNRQDWSVRRLRAALKREYMSQR